ncbi:MAG: nucleotidyltransferase family protein [Rhizobiales bacterium]|nr:nucleotidyltransferase family protein [Rhizobacter sp.]
MGGRPAVIVLAAGKGSRFLGNDHKLVQSLGALTVLGSTLQHAIASHLQVVVVTTQALADVARRSVAARDVVVLPEVGASGHKALGMGYSISAGVAARPDAAGWLVLPGDMPRVQPLTLQAVARQLAHHAVAYAQHKGRRGHPVGFSAELYSELSALSGDEGARRLVARYPAFGVEVDDPGVLVDVDTLADLDKVRRAEEVAAAPAPRW